MENNQNQDRLNRGEGPSKQDVEKLLNVLDECIQQFDEFYCNLKVNEMLSLSNNN